MPHSQSIQVKDLLHLTGYTAVAGIKAVKTATVVPFKGKKRHGDKTYVRKVLYEVINDYMIGVSVKEVQFVHPSTHTSYKMVCVRKGLKQRENVLPHNTKAYWLNYNEKTKKNVLVWFHGGGYVLACTDGHIRFLYSDLVKKTGNKYAVCILAYTLAPERQYPTQLIQASTLINYLIKQERIEPRNIVIGGDSAGGNLALGLLGHATHPHPDCPPLALKEGEMFRAALLMSPWVTFDSNSPSMLFNEQKDYICRRSLRKWHEAFMGTAKLDAYNTPLDAPQEWWQGVPVKSILFTGGGDELFRSDIEALGTKIQGVHPNTRVMIVQGDVHDQPFIDRILYMKTGKQCKNIISWLSTLEIPGFESDRKMDFSHSLSVTSYRSLASHSQRNQLQQQSSRQSGNRLRKVNMSAHIVPMESPDEIPEGKLEHMETQQQVDERLHGRLPTDNGVNTGTNKIDHDEDPPELRDNRVNWQHPPSMEVLHARHRHNSDPRPQSPEDYARLHREENERYMREWREKQEEQRREREDRRREQERANRPAARHQLSDPSRTQPMTNGNGNAQANHSRNYSYDQNQVDPQYMPMPASPPRSDDLNPLPRSLQVGPQYIPMPDSPPRSDEMNEKEKPLPLNPGQRQGHGQTRQLEIPGFQEGSPFRQSSNYSDQGMQGYDLGTLGGELTPQVSCRSVRSQERKGSQRSHGSQRSQISQRSRPETGNSVRTEEYVKGGHYVRDGYNEAERSNQVSPLERVETPEVHEARMEQLVRARTGEAREWHDFDGNGRRF